MKFRRLFVGFLILVFAALFILGIYLQMNGKQLAEESLSRVFKRPVRVGQAHVLPPLGLGLNNVEIEGMLKAKSVNIHLQLPIVFNQQLLISKLMLVDPLIFVARNKEAHFTVKNPQAPADLAALPLSQTSPAQFTKKPFIQGLFVNHLEIRNGKIQYTDGSFEKDYKIRLEGLALKAGNVSYPFKPVKSTCRFSVIIRGEEIAFSGSQITGDGWVNFGKKDMNGILEALVPDGKKWLQVNLVSQDNDMTVEGKMDINQVINTSRNEKNVSLEDFVLGALQSSGLQVGLGFKFKTKMDAFKVDSVSLFGQVRQEKSGEDKTFSENLEAIGKQLESLGKKGQQDDNLNAATPVVEPATENVETPVLDEAMPEPAEPAGNIAQ